MGEVNGSVVGIDINISCFYIEGKVVYIYYEQYGARIDPCGTPILKLVRGSERVLLPWIRVTCFLFVR